MLNVSPVLSHYALNDLPVQSTFGLRRVHFELRGQVIGALRVRSIFQDQLLQRSIGRVEGFRFGLFRR